MTSLRVLVIAKPPPASALFRRPRRIVATIKALCQHLTAAGARTTLRWTEKSGDAGRWAAQASTADWDLLVIAGGDGTINDAVNGLCRLAAEQRPPLAVVPLGTANVLAKELGLPPLTLRSVPLWSHGLLQGGTLSIPLAEVLDASWYHRRYGVLMVGAGLDSHVVRRLNPTHKLRWGALAYLWEAAEALRRYRYPTLRGSVDGVPFQAQQVILSCGRLYAGGFTVVPEGNLTEPTLTLTALRQTSAWDVLKDGLRLLWGRGLPCTGVLHEDRRQSCHTVMLTADDALPVQIDGDDLARLPLVVRISDQVLQVRSFSAPSALTDHRNGH